MSLHEFLRYQKDLKNARAKYRRAIESRNETARQDAAHAEEMALYALGRLIDNQTPITRKQVSQ
jgi:F0F1-type ATP synthase membrane subunit b/b'